MDNGREISYLRDLRKNYIIYFDDSKGKYVCCGVLVDEYQFIAPTDCVKSNKAYMAYIRNTQLCTNRLVDTRYRREIPNDLIIGKVSSLSKKSPVTFEL